MEGGCLREVITHGGSTVCIVTFYQFIFPGSWTRGPVCSDRVYRCSCSFVDLVEC